MIRSSLTAFFKTLCVVIGIGAGFMLISFGSSFLPNAIEPYIQTTTIAYPGVDGSTKLTGPIIARINIHGIIGMGDLRAEKVQALLDATQTGIYQGRTKALVLHINSPGGGAVESNDIYNALIAYKKRYQIPIYAYADGLCASGGMMVAAATDKILTSPTSIIGSVGVILPPFFNVTDLMAKVGISAEIIKKGKYKDELSPFRPWGPNEGAQMRHLTDAMYSVFVDIIAKERPKLTKARLEELGAGIFMAPQAIELGYTDGVAASMGEALVAFAQMSSLPSDSAVIGPMIRHSLIELLSAKQGDYRLRVEHEIQGLPIIPEELQGKACYLYLPGAS